MDLIVLVNIFIILIILTACVVDIYKHGYESWKDYLWMGVFLLLPVGFILFHLYY